MSTQQPVDPVIGDDELVIVRNAAGEWLVSWHPPTEAPDGTPHGANAFCLTGDGHAVLISEDGTRFGWPGGRPEIGESWEQTLRREVAEECCCSVTEARLLGFVRAECRSGQDAGAVLVRSIWRANVDVGTWSPEHEIVERRLVPLEKLRLHLWMEDGFESVYGRALLEAGL